MHCNWERSSPKEISHTRGRRSRLEEHPWSLSLLIKRPPKEELSLLSKISSYFFHSSVLIFPFRTPVLYSCVESSFRADDEMLWAGLFFLCQYKSVSFTVINAAVIAVALTPQLARG